MTRSVRIICPACRAEVVVNQRALGRKMRCPQCDQVITAAESPSTAASPPAPGAARSTVPPVSSAASAPPPPPRWTVAMDPTPPPLPPQPAAVLDEATPSVKKKAQRAFAEAEMDMTPMVDVVFQLLIFFMLTAAFTIVKSQQHPKPDQTQPAKVLEPEEDPDYIVIRIDAGNTYHVGGGDLTDEEEAPSPLELLSKLKFARGGLGGKIPTKLLVKAHGDCTHDRVVMAIDAGNDVGIEEVKVLTVEEEE